MRTSAPRTVFDLIRSKPAPRYALWELTQRCPADCIHCYLGRRADHSDLGLAECLIVLDKLRDAGVIFLALTGGEATVHRHFFAVAEAARARGLAVSLFTAAYHLTARQVRRIIALDLLKIEVSILGLNETHDALMRRPGSYEKMLRNVKAFRDAGLAVVLKSVMMPENAWQIPQVRKLAEELGCAYKPTAQVLSRTDNHERQPMGELTWDERREAVRAMEGDRLRLAGRQTPHEALICGAGRTAWSLSPGGDVFPCNILRIPCGNLVRQSWEEIWYSKPMREVRECTVEDVKGCRGCGVMGTCKRCPGQAYMETGDFRAPSRIDCEIAALRAEIRGEAVTRPFADSDFGADSSIVQRLPIIQAVG